MFEGYKMSGRDTSFRQSAEKEFLLNSKSSSPIFMYEFNVHMETSTWVLVVSYGRYGVLQTGKRITTLIPVMEGSKLPPSK